MEAGIKRRRRHSAQFKAQVLAECAQPGASVAEVARRYDLNDNMVHHWRRGHGLGAPGHFNALPAQSADPFVALRLPAPAASPAPGEAASAGEPIRLAIERGPLSVSITWPMAQAIECACWLREVLR